MFLHFAFNCLFGKISVITLGIESNLTILLLNLCKILCCLPSLFIVEIKV